VMCLKAYAQASLYVLKIVVYTHVKAEKY